MLGKILESLYVKVFINIIVERSSTVVYIVKSSKGQDISQDEHVFQTTKFTNEIYDFISDHTSESPYYYISCLDTSKEQGALPTCDKNKLAYYKDLSTSEYKCMNKQWSIYTSKTDLYEIERKYEDLGVDFIFSPFSLITKFFKDKIDKHLAMFALIENSSISIAVFENSEFLYGEYLDMEIDLDAENIAFDELDEDEKDEVLDLDDDDGIILDDMDVDDELEDFSDIEDLDSLEDIEEFSEGKDLEEELYENEIQETTATDTSEESDHFNEDYQRFSLIQSAINHFYKDEKYESKFLENIYIADATKVSPDLKRYLEEEMFLNVYVRSVDLGAELCELAKEELGL